MKPWLRAYLVNGSMQDEIDYSSMSFVALKQLAKDRGIKFKTAIRKTELIALLEEYDDRKT